MKLDQIAYYAHNEAQVASIKTAFGVEDAEWVEDIATGNVVATSCLTGQIESGISKGHLRFNYSLGIELEILTYLEGPHWHSGKIDFGRGVPFLSHLGFHMDEGERPPENVLSTGLLVQTMDTTEHTNDYVNSRGRKYHYEIYKMPSGPDLKYIWRVGGAS